jgi:hypothetical protein
VEAKRRGPEFQPLADNTDCEAKRCLRPAKYVAKWPFVVERVCDTHRAEVDGKPWEKARSTFGTSIAPK